MPAFCCSWLMSSASNPKALSERPIFSTIANLTPALFSSVATSCVAIVT
jgi:hypothetical protein